MEGTAFDGSRLHPVRHEVLARVLGRLVTYLSGVHGDGYGERGGTRTLDPMIKSHVLYRLSYALTCPDSICRCQTADTTPPTKPAGSQFGRLMRQTALCRGWAGAGQ